MVPEDILDEECEERESPVYWYEFGPGSVLVALGLRVLMAAVIEAIRKRSMCFEMSE